MKDRRLYPIDEARELLGGISRNTLYLLIQRGELSSVQIGRRRFISAVAISEFIAASTSAMSPPDDLADTRRSPPATERQPSDPAGPRRRHEGAGK